MITEHGRILDPEAYRITLYGVSGKAAGRIYSSFGIAQHNSTLYNGYDYWSQSSWNRLCEYNAEHPGLILETVYNDRITHRCVLADVKSGVSRKVFRDGKLQIGIPEALLDVVYQPKEDIN